MVHFGHKNGVVHTLSFFKKNLHNQKDKKVHEGFMEQWPEG